MSQRAAFYHALQALALDGGPEAAAELSRLRDLARAMETAARAGDREASAEVAADYTGLLLLSSALPSWTWPA
jgi:hypothetical protein